VQAEIPQPPDPDNWRACRDYLYGIDLFNNGFYWEAHEAWEGLWAACGRRGPTATYLQALINLAAAGLKAEWGSAPRVRANAGTAVRLFKSFANQVEDDRTRYMGLDFRALAAFADSLSATPQAGHVRDCDGNVPVFDLVLWPE
jgi:predicted metal-dependent hydrolase